MRLVRLDRIYDLHMPGETKPAGPLYVNPEHVTAVGAAFGGWTLMHVLAVEGPMCVVGTPEEVAEKLKGDDHGITPLPQV